MDTDPSSQTDTDQEVPLRTQASLTKAALFLPIDASRPSSATPGHGVLTAKQVSELVPERGAPEPPSGSHVHARGNHDEAEEAAGSRTPTAHAQEDRGPPPLPSPRHEVSEGQLTRYGELEREFSDKFSDVFGENWTKEHEHEVDRMLFASVSRIRGHNTELGACVHDFNCWRETVAKQSLVPNNVLSRCTIIAGRLLRSEAALRVGVEQLLDDVLKITPDSMRRHLGTLLADCRSERRLRMLMEKERDEAVKADGSPSAIALAACMADVNERLQLGEGERFNHCVLNLYRDGNDEIGWHADDEPQLGRQPLVAALSLGARRDFHIKRRGSRNRRPSRVVPLRHGSLLVCGGTFQHTHLHSVPRHLSAVGTRINVTFRRIAAPPCSPT